MEGPIQRHKTVRVGIRRQQRDRGHGSDREPLSLARARAQPTSPASCKPLCRCQSPACPRQSAECESVELWTTTNTSDVTPAGRVSMAWSTEARHCGRRSSSLRAGIRTEMGQGAEFPAAPAVEPGAGVRCEAGWWDRESCRSEDFERPVSRSEEVFRQDLFAIEDLQL